MRFLDRYGESLLTAYVVGMGLTFFVFDWRWDDSLLWPLVILRSWWNK